MRTASVINFADSSKRYEGHSEITDTLPLFPNENERFIHQLETQLFHCLHYGGRILLFTVPIKAGRKEETQLIEENLNVALTPSSTSLRVKTAISCMLSLNIENRGE